ncbi:hypothetical protein Tco_0306091 [Tanacetum coccineum]
MALLEVGQIRIQFWVMGNDSLRSSPRRGANLYGARATGVAPRIRSIWNSTWRIGGRPCRSSGKTYGNSLNTGISSSLFSSDFFSITWITKT